MAPPLRTVTRGFIQLAQQLVVVNPYRDKRKNNHVLRILTEVIITSDFARSQTSTHTKIILKDSRLPQI